MMNTIFQKDVLKDKVALITGGATGINFVVGKVLGLHGAKLVIMGRRLEVLQKAKEEFSKLGITSAIVQGDVRSAESADKVVKETVNQFGRLDILVNGAAGNFLCPAENLSTNAFKTVVEIDLVGTFNMSRAAFTELAKTKGTIVNISATLHYTATPWQVHASAAKAGVDSVTQSIAREWGNFGIRCVGIAPGPIKDTEGASRLGLGPSPAELEQLIQQRVPLGKMGTKEDIGYAALFLVSGAANYVTGTTLVVDGGEWLHREPMISREALQMLQSQRKKSKL